MSTPKDSNFHVLKNVLIRRRLIAEREHISSARKAKSPQQRASSRTSSSKLIWIYILVPRRGHAFLHHAVDLMGIFVAWSEMMYSLMYSSAAALKNSSLLCKRNATSAAPREAQPREAIGVFLVVRKVGIGLDEHDRHPRMAILPVS